MREADPKMGITLCSSGVGYVIDQDLQAVFLHPMLIFNVNECSSDSFTAGENGGGMNAAIIGGVVAAVIVVLICLLVVVLRYRYRDKGTYHTNEAKGTEFAENADAALKNDPSLQEAIDETKKEYFI
uniref:Glycophorin C (Gerbich blood group) n=2 Tax=Xenopus tropicalis TaxID=8364 RepID=A0A803JKW3_XENTR